MYCSNQQNLRFQLKGKVIKVNKFHMMIDQFISFNKKIKFNKDNIIQMTLNTI